MDVRGQGGRIDRVTVACLGCLLACIVPAQVQAQAPGAPVAQEPDAAAYTEAIGEAVGHYSGGRWREAQIAFARAHALQPSARTYRGLGLSAFYLEDFAAAREAFEQALTDTRRPLAEDQRHEVADLLRACASNTGRFEVRVDPPSARVEIDGAVTEQRVLFLARGKHALAANADGYSPRLELLTVMGGEERSVDFALTAVQRSELAPPARAPDGVNEPSRASVGARSSTVASTPPKSASSGPDGRVVTWIVAGTVPLFAGVAAAVWFTGKAERDAIERDCVRDRCDRAEANRRVDDASLDAHATWTNVSLVASGVALVAASVLYVVEGHEPGGPEIKLSAARSGAALRGRF
jgi:hypothetical protein